MIPQARIMVVHPDADVAAQVVRELRDNGRDACAAAVATENGLSLSDVAEIENHQRALRELVAFLVTHGFASATRARIASATAEVLENVANHAYPGSDGPFHLRASLHGRHLSVEITDDGVGFDPARLAIDREGGPIASGLARARSLAEDFHFANRPEGGARVTLGFTATSVLFADERGIDLSELDYLDPATARRVLASLRDGSTEPAFHLSPALAVCVGRLLSAPRPAESPMAELWS